MMKTFVKQTKQKVKDEAIKTGKQMMQEFGEFPKDASRQLGFEQNQSPVNGSSSDNFSTDKPEYREDVKENEKRLDYLQREIDELMQKKQQEEYAVQKQEAIAKQDQGGDIKGNPWENQISKRKIGLPFMQGKKAKGTGEMIRSKK